MIFLNHEDHEERKDTQQAPFMVFVFFVVK